jgi:hypothetical protein
MAAALAAAAVKASAMAPVLARAWALQRGPLRPPGALVAVLVAASAVALVMAPSLATHRVASAIATGIAVRGRRVRSAGRAAARCLATKERATVARVEQVAWPARSPADSPA